MRWWPQPLAGDLVWCHFPRHPELKPGPKSRPALIVKVFKIEIETEPRRYAVRVAYGTSQKVDRLHAGEFVISPDDGEAYQFSGLSYPTKFDLGNALELPYNDEYFGLAPGKPHGQSPKLGTLHPSLVRRARAALQASGPE